LSHRRNARREARAFASARLVVVPSRGLEAELIEAYPFLEGRTVCIPNPIDTERFSRPEGFDGTSLRAEHGLRPEELVAVFVALGDFARKGLKLAMEAIAVADLAAVRLLVVGGQPGEIEVFRKIARTLGIESRIVFAGFRRDIRPFLWASDLFVFPSLYETFCLVAFQAALAQLPLILTRVHGVEDFIQPGEHGWLVQRDAIAVRQALRQALADPGRLSAMGRAAALAAQSYSKGAFVQRWRQAYRDLESGAFRRTAHA
jgi:glycosyltransferase involved in cell wall biosynthesis